MTPMNSDSLREHFRMINAARTAAFNFWNEAKADPAAPSDAVLTLHLAASSAYTFAYYTYDAYLAVLKAEGKDLREAESYYPQLGEVPDGTS